MLIEGLLTHAARQPAALAIVDDRGQYSYGQMAAMATAMSRYLAAQTKSGRIGLLLPPGAGFVASFYGALLAGKAVVPINYLLTDRDIAHCVTDSGIDAVVSIPQLAVRLKETPLNVIDLTQLEQSLPAGAASSSATPSAPAPNAPAAAPDDLAVLMYTSGTSGLPKGVLLTYGNLQSSVDASIAHMAFRSTHKFLGVIPLFHVFGLVATML